MLNLFRFQLTFKPSFRMSILALLSICLFCSLGMWQIRRADEKKMMLSAVHQAKKNIPIQWNSNLPFPPQYHPIQVQGHFAKPILLLDNQFENHQLGYHVLSPLILKDQTIVLIDRGWIAREQISTIKTPYDSVTITGTVYFPSTKQWVLGEPIDVKSPNLVYVEKIDHQLLSQFLQKSVYPFIIRQQDKTPYGYIRHWKIINMPWQRHWAYAFQWFTIAGVILLIYLILNTKYETKQVK